MSRKDIRIAELEAEILRLKKNSTNDKLEISKLTSRNNSLMEVNEELKRYYKGLMSEAKLKNDALISAIKSKDTEIFIYNGDTYRIKELRFNQCADCLDSLDLELVKVDNIVSYNGGLIGAMENAIKNVSESLTKVFYGDNNCIPNVAQNNKE